MPHPEHGAAAGAVVEIHFGCDPVGCVKGVVVLPFAVKDLLVDAAVFEVFPAFEAAAVAMGA